MSEEIQLQELLLKLKELKILLISKWKTFAVITIIGGFLGFLYAKNEQKVYNATLTFAIEDEQAGSIGGSLASQFGLNLGGSSENGGIFSSSNLIELLKSRRMVEKTLLFGVPYQKKIISLAEMFLMNNKWGQYKVKNKFKKIIFEPNKDRLNFTLDKDSLLGKISEKIITENLIVKEKDKKSSIIVIDLNSNNEIFAKYFTEALVKVVSDDYIELKSKKSRLNQAILQRQSDSVRIELYNAISGAAIANDNAFNLNPALNIHRIPSAKKEVDIQANGAILTELVKQLELSKITVRKETPFIQIIDKPILPLKFTKFGKLKGIIIGSFISMFITLIILMTTYFIKKTMSLNKI